MNGIGGNITAIIQLNADTADNGIELVPQWVNTQTLKGWLDLASGESKYITYSAKIQESTHIFIADYTPLAPGVTAENSRMIINGDIYDIMLIDNPMELKKGSQWEIYLKYTGNRIGAQNV